MSGAIPKTFAGLEVQVSPLCPPGTGHILNPEALKLQGIEAGTPRFVIRDPADLGKFDEEEVRRMFAQMKNLTDTPPTGADEQ